MLPIPKHAALVNIRYDSFDAALRDARALVAVQAASIETVDSRVLGLARNDIVWHEVQEFFPDDPEGPAEGINLVELLADDADGLEAQLARVTATLEREGRTSGRRGFTVARNEVGTSDQRAFGGGAQGSLRVAEDGDEAEADGAQVAPTPAVKAVERIWGMRKKAVGLLGNMAGSRRPIPFVEDTAVPPEHLADYIAEFRAALDRRGLVYGMFGHVDAGVLHVRPAIDMTDPAQEPLIREISDEVVALTRKYGGVLWGEHGKGVRSEYTPAFFGPLYPCLQRIKAAFDPHDQLNPGKIAAPAEGRLLRIDEVPTRGGRERVIPPGVRESYDNALHCNGNGACYDFDLDAAMCPSWKGTRERRHSPKGRASALREWLRLMVAEGVDPVAEAARLRATPAWRTLPARIVSTIGKHRGAPRLLARGQGDDGWLPRLQGVRRPVPDQGRRAGLPGEVPGALPRPLSAPGEGRAGRCHRASPADGGTAAGPLQPGGRQPPGPARDEAARACRPAAAAGPPARPRARRARHPNGHASGSWRRCRRRSGRAASSSCRTPSPAISRRALVLDLVDLLAAPRLRALAGAVPAQRQAHARARLSGAVRSASPRAMPRCSAPWPPRTCRWWASTRR